MKKTLTAILITALALTVSSAAFADSAGSVEADELSYNMNTKYAAAVGNVIFTKDTDVLKGSKAYGTVDKQITVTGSPVLGEIASRDAKLTAAKVVWTAGHGMENDDTVAASGNVRIRQGKGNFLNAAAVKINSGRKIYEATGNAEILYNGIYVKALEIFRNGENFRSSKVARAEDRIKKYALSAETVTGKISAKDEILSAVAENNVIFDYTDKNGIKSRLCGDKAVYDRSQNTVTVTGNARGIREDGKTVRADKLIYNEKTKQIDAAGRTKITFITEK